MGKKKNRKNKILLSLVENPWSDTVTVKVAGQDAKGTSVRESPSLSISNF